MGNAEDDFRQFDEATFSMKACQTCTTSSRFARVMQMANWHTYQVLTERICSDCVPMLAYDVVLRL